MPTAQAGSVIGADAGEVWSVVRDFNGLPGWYPGVASSKIEEGLSADQVGAMRDFHLDDGTRIREKLLELSDEERYFTYSLETAPFDVRDYVARLTVYPVTDEELCYAQWRVRFDCLREDTDHWVHHFGHNVFQFGLHALKARFAGAPAPEPYGEAVPTPPSAR